MLALRARERFAEEFEADVEQKQCAKHYAHGQQCNCKAVGIVDVEILDVVVHVTRVVVAGGDGHGFGLAIAHLPVGSVGNASNGQAAFGLVGIAATGGERGRHGHFVHEFTVHVIEGDVVVFARFKHKWQVERASSAVAIGNEHHM